MDNILACICMMLLVVACQKEATQTVNPQAGVTQTHFVKNNGTSVKTTGTSSSLDGDAPSDAIGEAIGWFLDLTGLVGNDNVKSSDTPGGPLNASNLGSSNLYCGGIKTVTLYAGQTIAMGTLAYANDAYNLYVTYTTNSDWFMSEIHLYAGTLANAPTSGAGTPAPGKFPINRTYTASTLQQSVTFTIPLSTLPSTGLIIAAHASVLQVESDGAVVSKETAWGAGPRFNSSKNWSTYVNATLGSCRGGTVGDFKATSNNNK